MEELKVPHKYMFAICNYLQCEIGDNSIGCPSKDSAPPTPFGSCTDEMEQIVVKPVKQESFDEVNIGNVAIKCMFHVICVVFLTITS